MRNLASEMTLGLDWPELEVEDIYAVDVFDKALAVVEAEPLESDYRHVALDVLSEVLDYQASWGRAQEDGWYYEN